MVLYPESSRKACLTGCLNMDVSAVGNRRLADSYIRMSQPSSNPYALSKRGRSSFLLVSSLLLTTLVQAGQAPGPAPVGVPASTARLQPAEPLAGEAVESEKELKQEEHQRILGILPNFNTTSLQNRIGLSPKQKIELAAKTALDPFAFLVAAIDSGVGQADNSFKGYGQGMQGYGKRFGAAYADSFDGTMVGNAFLPILFRSDPRYFRKGTGSFMNRTLYAFASTVRARKDNGEGWTPNYANVLGNIAAGGISNLYYPSSDRGVDLTFQRALTVTAEGCIGAFFVEFWPDVVAHYKKKHTKAPGN